jgi:N-acetylglutamate synthase-like GNAT family acetyltransferase
MSITAHSAPELRPATPADLPAVERLLTAAHLPLDGVAGALGAFTVAETGDGESRALVGVAGLEVCCDNALLRSVAVAPEWQGRGLGRLLVERVVAEAEAQGLNALYLLTTTAERYFPSFGFERVERGAVPADVRGTAEFRDACPASAVVMERRLGAAR